MEWAMSTTESDYERWLAGRATITEITTDAVRLLREQVEAAPGLSRMERYTMAVSILTTSVDPELREELFGLIRGGAIDG
jgi:hypothetical protein